MSTHEFYTSITVLDTETTNLLADQAEIVELAAARFDPQAGWVVRDRLFNAHNGIPPAASAKNNISPRMIRDQPYWDQCVRESKDMLAWDTARYFVAHNCSYDQSVLATAWDRCGSSADVQSARNAHGGSASRYWAMTLETLNMGLTISDICLIYLCLTVTLAIGQVPTH